MSIFLNVLRARALHERVGVQDARADAKVDVGLMDFIACDDMNFDSHACKEYSFLYITVN